MLGFPPSPTLYSLHTSVTHIRDLDILYFGTVSSKAAFQGDSLTMGAVLAGTISSFVNNSYAVVAIPVLTKNGTLTEIMSLIDETIELAVS
jgi:hypothetical protein